MLLHTFLEILACWAPFFPQQRSFQQARRLALGGLLACGRRQLSRILCALGLQDRDWSAAYYLFSRCRWEPQQLFAPILRQALPFCRGRLIGVAVDDTRLRKTGRSIVQAFFGRDPMSPPFHVNLTLGLRFLQASLLLPLHGGFALAARALPIRFQEVSRLKRPRKKAPPQEWKQYRQAAKRRNLSHSFVDMMADLRNALDAAGAALKTLVLAVDGSFCNRVCFRARRDRTELIARTRKNAVLCFPAVAGSRRFYAPEKFTPEQIRQQEHRPWRTTKIFYGSKRHKVRYKEVANVLWQGGAGRLLLRLFVVAPTPYQKRKGGRLLYRQSAYLLTTDLHSSPHQLLQIYFDRWQIEVNHREEKDTLGVGEAQLRNIRAVPKQPALAVAAYSALLLASLLTFGPHRTSHYAALPKWRGNAKRPSCLDLVTLLRKEAGEHPEVLENLGIHTSFQRMNQAAAA